jgi:hypothetical protein
MRFLLGIGTALVFVLPSHSHDSYSGLRDSAGRLCCGDQDCERVDRFTVHPDASVTFFSRRWQADIRVAADRIVWLAVGAGPATWCGNISYEPITYCAFVDPPGS